MSALAPESPHLDKKKVDRWQVLGGISSVGALALTMMSLAREILPLPLIVSGSVTFLGVVLLHRWGTSTDKRTKAAFIISVLVTIVGTATAGVTGGAAYQDATNASKTPNTAPTGNKATATGSRAKAAFAAPKQDQAMTDLGIPVFGSIQNLGKDEKIWLTTRESPQGPMNTYQPQSGPCTVLDDDKFECPIVYAGAPGFPEKKYDVILLAVSSDAAKEFVRYDEGDPGAHGYPGLENLPSGATLIGTVQVIRHED